MKAENNNRQPANKKNRTHQKTNQTQQKNKPQPMWHFKTNTAKQNTFAAYDIDITNG